MKKILCFGNPLIAEDNLAMIIGKELFLEGYEFILCDSPENIMNHTDAYAILDVALGITEIKILKDFDQIKPMNMSSVHDFDLSFFLKLLESTGKLESMKIIALPASMNLYEAKTRLTQLLG